MISEAVINLCRQVREAGGRALLVGGWVRDYKRGIETSDYDLEVYGLDPVRLREMIERLGPVNAVGEAFTVYKVRLRDDKRRFVVDVSLPRRESKTGRGHRGFVITGDPFMSFYEAARRRDFTINAMLYDPLRDEYIDPHHGLEDLNRGIIRVVDPETFVEDSLRVLRGMQLAARLEFAIDPETVSLCKKIDLSDLPAERIWGEVEKWLLQSRRPSIGLREARELGIVDRLWPEIRVLIGCPQPESEHPEGDVFDHTALVLDEARKLIDDLSRPRQIAVMLAALCHDFGKPLTTKFEKEFFTAHNHEEAGIGPVRAFLDRLRVFSLDNYDVRHQVLALVGHHLTPVRWFDADSEGEPVTDGMFRRLAFRVEPELLYRVELANRLGRGGKPDPEAEEWFIRRVRRLGVGLRPPEPFLLGRHLLDMGLEQGTRIGEITKAVYEMQLDGNITSLAEALTAAQTILVSKSGEKNERDENNETNE